MAINRRKQVQPGLSRLGGGHFTRVGIGFGVLVLTTAADAYIVRTNASTFGGPINSQGCEATYNAVGSRDGALFVLGGVGGARGTCPRSPYTQFNGALVTYAGTIDAPGTPIGTATSATDSSSNIGATFSASAFAASALASGSLRAQAGSTVNANATAIAFFDDSIDLKAAGASSTTVTPIHVIFNLDGSIVDNVRSGSSSARVNWDMHFANAFFSAQINSTSINGYVPRVEGQSQGGWASFSMSSNTVNSIHFDGIFDLIGSELLTDATGGLSVTCNDGPSCDFSHTATMRFGLPAGVTFTSGSGVFLSASAVPAVPEPGSYLLMALGLGALGFTMACRRRRLLGQPAHRRPPHP